jgi:hypothetical protein
VRSAELDVLALMAGVGFAGLGLAALLGGSAGVAGRWTWPVLFIVIGVAGLAASRRSAARRSTRNGD